MNDLRSNGLSLLMLMVVLGVAACSSSVHSPRSIAAAGEIMRSKIVSQTGISQTSTSQTSISQTGISQTHTSQTSTTSSQNHSTASTTISLSAANLKYPHRLIIHSSGDTLTGQIILDGEVIQSLRSNPTEINLSPYLSAGRHTIEIVSSSTPTTANLTVEFVAPGTRTMQQTNGGSRLQLLLLVN